MELAVGTASRVTAAASTHTWNFTGDFKASLSSSKFDHDGNGGNIKLSMTPSNCSPDFDHINVNLLRVNSLNIVTWRSGTVTFPCDQTSQYTWTDMSNAGYRFYFSRSGPTEFDETTKHIAGTVTY